MNTIKNEKKEICRSVIVRITPKWELVPEEYKSLKIDKAKIISHICEKYIEMVANVNKVPAVLIENGELGQNELNKIKIYAQKLGLIIVLKEEFVNKENIKIVDIMSSFKNYTYGEKKWELVARKRLKREIDKA